MPSHRCEFGLLDVQFFGLRKLEQRTQIAGASGVNDDDALALFELGDDVVAVNRRQQQHGDGEEKPEPRQPVTLVVGICRCSFDRAPGLVWESENFQGGLTLINFQRTLATACCYTRNETEAI